jgi:hypothetical protein
LNKKVPIRVFVFLVLIHLHLFSFSALTPSPRLPIFKEKGLVENIGASMLRRYTEKRVSNLTSLSEFQKQDFFFKDPIASVSVILFEFSTGTGPDTRYFDRRSAFGEQIARGPAVRYLIKTYFDQMIDTMTLVSSGKMRYQFSILPQDPSTWIFGAKALAQVVKENNVSQFMLGSFFAQIEPIGDGRLRVHIWNVTSRKSYFLGLGLRVQRPKPLGNVTQHIFLDFSYQEARSIAKR